MTHQRFVLIRDEDVTGISGTGPVAEGLLFTDGTAVLRWTSEHKSTAVYEDGMEAIKIIHGHQGKTRIVWLDPSDT